MYQEVIFRNPRELFIHPLNAYFFDSPDEGVYQQLKKDIADEGVLEPVIITQDDVIVSGANRTAICIELDRSVPTITKLYDGDNKEDLIVKNLINANIKRRGGNDLGDGPIKESRRQVELERIAGIVFKRGGYRHGERKKGDMEADATEDYKSYDFCASEGEKVKVRPADFDYIEDINTNNVCVVEQQAKTEIAYDPENDKYYDTDIILGPGVEINSHDDLAAFLRVKKSRYHRNRKLVTLEQTFQDMVESKTLPVKAAEYLTTLKPEMRQKILDNFDPNEAWTICTIKEVIEQIKEENDRVIHDMTVAFDAERHQSAKKLETAVQKAYDMERAGMRYKQDADEWRNKKLAADQELEQTKAASGQMARAYQERYEEANRRADAAYNMSAKNSAHSAALEEELEALRQAQATTSAPPSGELLAPNSVTTLDHSLRMLIMHYGDPANLQLDVPPEHLCSLHSTLYSSVEGIRCLSTPC